MSSAGEQAVRTAAAAGWSVRARSFPWQPLLPAIIATAFVAVAVGVWHVASTSGWVSPVFLPAPGRVAESFVNLLTKGYVGSFEEAFDDWLGDGKRAHVPRFVVSPAEAAGTLHQAGGIAVLAHPLGYGRSPEVVRRSISAAKKAGLDGVEVHTASQTPGETTMISSFVAQAGLLASGGSDIHVPPWPDTPRLSPKLLEPLALRAERGRAEPR
jgi:hypothetical protein